ncbi:MAG TPA: NAD(P)/FAD-dependent oxidoreductase [Rubrobacter sp.]|nr:NAD(P)/FAD-dependent oxidoreductase [Rubrobacter sp.]
MADARYDAIVVGAGHNGLVCAAYLSRAGWKTVVVERNEKIGGAVMSGEVTRPGFVHDLYSMNQNLFLASPVYAELKEDLERHGLRYKTSPKPYSNVFPDGKSLRVYNDQERTMRPLRDHSPEDAEGFERLYDRFEAFGKAFLPIYGMPLPSAEAVWDLVKATRSQGLNELADLAQIILSSTRELGDAYFSTPEMKALVATWGMHMDFGPDISGGAMFPFMETFADMEAGMSVVEGGASRMPEALAGLTRENGGEVRTESEVTRILTEDGRATGVELASGERIMASRAVVANLTPKVLFERLVDEGVVSPRFRRRVKRYQHGLGTMMVHLALSGRLRWAAEGGDLDEFAYVHIPPYVEDLSRTYTASMNGHLPESPLLIVGQTSAVDPSRAPNEGEVLWIQVRTLPSEIRGDAAGEIGARTWEEAKQPVADRVMAKLEEYAPGVGEQVLDRTVFSPADLEHHNPNLAGGDSIGGSFHLRQNFVFRPFPGFSNYKMPVEDLYMVGAATWPGPGTNATSGYLAAKKILRKDAMRATLLKGGAAAGALGAAALAARRLARSGR